MRVINIVFLLLAAAVTLVTCRPANKTKRWALPEHGFLHFLRYFYFTTLWDEANNVCNQYGGQLVTAETPERREVIQNFMKSKGVHHDFWIGLQRADAASPFVWTGGGQEALQEDGQLLWQEPPPAEPGRLCVKVNPDDDFRLQASSCEQTRVTSFLCQIEVPDYARGPNGCITDKVSTLSASYLAHTEGPGVVQLTSNCGLDGTRTIICQGAEDQEEIIKKMTCGNVNVASLDLEAKSSTAINTGSWGSFGTRHKRDSTSTAIYTENPDTDQTTTDSTYNLQPSSETDSEKTQEIIYTTVHPQQVSDVTPAEDPSFKEPKSAPEVVYPVLPSQNEGQIHLNIAAKKTPPPPRESTVFHEVITESSDDASSKASTAQPFPISTQPTTTQPTTTSPSSQSTPQLTSSSAAPETVTETQQPDTTTPKILSRLPHPPLIQLHSKITQTPAVVATTTPEVFTTSTDVTNEITDVEEQSVPDDSKKENKSFKDETSSDEVQQSVDNNPIVLVEQNPAISGGEVKETVSEIVIEHKDEKILATSQVVDKVGEINTEVLVKNQDGFAEKDAVDDFTGPQIETFLKVDEDQKPVDEIDQPAVTHTPSPSVEIFAESATDDPRKVKNPVLLQELPKVTAKPQPIIETITDLPNKTPHLQTTILPSKSEADDISVTVALHDDASEVKQETESVTTQENNQPDTTMTTAIGDITKTSTETVQAKVSTEDPVDITPNVQTEIKIQTPAVVDVIEPKPVVKEVTTIRLSEFYGPEPSADVADVSEYSSEEAQSQSPTAKRSGRSRGLYHPAGPLSFYPYFLSKVLG